MFKLLFRYIASFFKKMPTRSTVVVNPISETKEVITEPLPVQKEIAYFTRANNLIEEFYDSPIRVWSAGEIMDEESKFKAVPDKEDNALLKDDVDLLTDKFTKAEFAPKVIAYQDYLNERTVK